MKFVEGDNFLRSAYFDSPVGHVVLVMVCSSWRQSLGIPREGHVTNKRTRGTQQLKDSCITCASGITKVITLHYRKPRHRSPSLLSWSNILHMNLLELVKSCDILPLK